MNCTRVISAMSLSLILSLYIGATRIACSAEEQGLFSPGFYDFATKRDEFMAINELQKTASRFILVDKDFRFNLKLGSEKYSRNRLKALLKKDSNKDFLCVYVSAGDRNSPPPKVWIDKLKRFVSTLGYRRVLIFKVLQKIPRNSGWEVIEDVSSP